MIKGTCEEHNCVLIRHAQVVSRKTFYLLLGIHEVGVVTELEIGICAKLKLFLGCCIRTRHVNNLKLIEFECQ